MLALHVGAGFPRRILLVKSSVSHGASPIAAEPRRLCAACYNRTSMRIPYPERISYTAALCFAALLLLAQLLEQTQPIFAFCCFAYIMVTVAAFNLSGGLYRPAGAFIFFNSVLSIILALVVKAFLGEAADANLVAPLRIIEVYLLGMVSMLIASFIETRFRPRRALIPSILPLVTLRGAYIGAAILGLASTFFWLSGPNLPNGGIFTALHNVDSLLPFALILGVVYNVRASNGQRTLSPALGSLFAFMSLLSLIYFSKQILFTPIFCWTLGAGLARYKLKPINYVTLALMIFILMYFGTPYVAVGKARDKPAGLVELASFSFNMLTHMDAIRKEYKEGAEGQYSKTNYFNHPEGIFDRLEMVAIDDLLVDTGDRNGFFGFEPTIEGWENLIPHIIWANKPVPYFGNQYAHALGILSDDDGSTGVSFSPSADAYYQGGFYGIIVVETACFTLIFLAFSFLVGDVRDHPAVLVLVLITAHTGPEGAIPGAIILILASAVVVGVAFLSRYVLPLIADVFQPVPLAVPPVRLPRHVVAAD